MGLRIVRGSSGCGKSSYIIDDIIKKSRANMEDNYIFIVPEQFTLETQKKVVYNHPSNAIMNIDILSFERLAYRIFEEQCVTVRTVLDDCGKLLILRKVCENNKEKLTYFGKNVHYIGFIEQVKSMISELMQYDITSDFLDRLVKENNINGMLGLKLNDINLIFSEYKKALGEDFISGEDILKDLCKYLATSKLVKRSTFVFDEFTGFTPVELKVIELLMIYAKDVIVSVTLDSSEDYKKILGKHELFYLSKHTIVTLLDIASKAQVKIYEDTVLDDIKPKRFASSEIAFLEKNIYRTTNKTYDLDMKDISIFEAFNPHSEIDYVIANIKRLIKEGYRYKDIAVVSADAKGISTYISKKFTFNNIPIFIDDKKDVINNPLVDLIRSAIIICDENFSYESVFRFLKTGLTNIDKEDVYALENYILATGIKGKSGYKRPFTKTYKKNSDFDLDYLNIIREKFYATYEPLYTVLTSKKSTVNDYIRAILEYLDEICVKDKLDKLKQEIDDEFLKKEMESIYDLIMDMFDKIGALTGNDKLLLEEFSGILDTGIEQIKISIIPPVTDSVLVGDIVRTRLNDIKILFFMGINDGNIPRKEDATNLLTEFDREKIEKYNITLAPTSKENMFIQNFYLYLNMSKPSHKLFLSYRKFDLDGKSIQKSYLIGNIIRLFPKLCIMEEKHFPWIDDYLKVTNSSYDRRIDDVSQINAEYANDLYGDELTGSISSIEQYMACAFAHFLKYGLKLTEREVYEINAADVGIIIHNSLKEMTTRLDKLGKDLRTIPDDEMHKLCKEVVGDVGRGYDNNIMSESSRNTFRLECVIDIVDISLGFIKEQLMAGKYQVADTEMQFDPNNKLSRKLYDDMIIHLKDDKRMVIGGRIDRIDMYDNGQNVYLKVVDYKTGKKEITYEDIYYGFSLQLLVYMKAALLKNKDKKPVPSGIFYNYLDSPIVEPTSEKDAKTLLNNELKSDGVIVEDVDIAETFDENVIIKKESEYYKYKLKKDGGFHKDSKVLPQDVFDVLPDYAMDKIRQAATEIVDGNIAINPYKRGDKTSCDYCQFKSICSFDKFDRNYRFRKIRKVDKDKLVEEIRTFKNNKKTKGE